MFNIVNQAMEPVRKGFYYLNNCDHGSLLTAFETTKAEYEKEYSKIVNEIISDPGSESWVLGKEYGKIELLTDLINSIK